MDIRMPGKKGNELAQRMRTMPQFAQTPIVLMTAYSLNDHERKDMMTTDGVDHILNKPLPDFDQLRTILHDSSRESRVMTPPNPSPPNEQELSGVIQRINRLGTASERLFSRLYKGLGHTTRQLSSCANRIASFKARSASAMSKSSG